MLLKIMGNNVRTASDGEKWVQAATEFRPHVVLLDIGLPKLNGHEACRLIRRQAWSQHTVLIAVTGWGAEDDRRQSQEAGFDYHMVKPVDPTSLSAAGGTTVSITGANFTGASAVNFGTMAATSFTIVSDTSITAIAPAQTAGTYDITVVTPSGTSSTSSADQFTFTAIPVPSITSISPNSGSTAGGTAVIITGSGFTGATAVSFGPALTASFTVTSDTQIVAVTPPNPAGTWHMGHQRDDGRRNFGPGKRRSVYVQRSSRPRRHIDQPHQRDLSRRDGCDDYRDGLYRREQCQLRDNFRQLYGRKRHQHYRHSPTADGRHL
jgi:CheY-like chemotaxis protein